MTVAPHLPPPTCNIARHERWQRTKVVIVAAVFGIFAGLTGAAVFAAWLWPGFTGNDALLTQAESQVDDKLYALYSQGTAVGSVTSLSANDRLATGVVVVSSGWLVAYMPSKKEEPKKNYNLNQGITAPEVLVLDNNNQNIGVMKTGEAILKAQEMGLDLVEINPKSTPPVAKIIDFGQFRYQQEKEARLQKAHQHVVDTKTVRLSLRIGESDLEIRRKQTIKFLNEGNMVKSELTLRGREMQQGPFAIQELKKFIESVQKELPIRLEQQVERAGNKVTAIIVKT